MRRPAASFPDRGGHLMEIWKHDGRIVRSFRGFRYVFGEYTGLPEGISIDGRELLAGPASLEVFRAPMDNDRVIRKHWEYYGIDKARPVLRKIRIFDDRPGSITFHTEHTIAAPACLPVAWVRSDWSVRNDGTLELFQKVDVRHETDHERGMTGGWEMFLPRYGVRMTLDKALDQVEYYGYGPGESYRDKHRASYKSRFAAKASRMFENYLKPQENGAHYDTEWLRITDSVGCGLEVRGESFSFGISPYTPHELAEAGHPHELPPVKKYELALDYAQSGCGSNSCGPELLPQYRLSEKEFMFHLVMRPVVT